MVEFKTSMGGLEVLVNGKFFGYISKERGFFTEPTAIKDFIEVKPSDFREIAAKVEEQWNSLQRKMRLSEWITVDKYCATRVIVGTDPCEVKNRIAFIEKTPRVRVSAGYVEQNNIRAYKDEDGNLWYYGPKGHAPSYGAYKPSRDWADEQLCAMGYELL